MRLYTSLICSQRIFNISVFRDSNEYIPNYNFIPFHLSLSFPIPLSSSLFVFYGLWILKGFFRIAYAFWLCMHWGCEEWFRIIFVSTEVYSWYYFGSRFCGFTIEQNHRLGLADGSLMKEPEAYRRLVGRLVYLVVTLPDLAYSVYILSQFMQEPRVDHWDATLRVVRYLKGTPGQGILLRADSNLTLQGWCDSDWAVCPITRRSLTGWFVFLGHSPISWKTKKTNTLFLALPQRQNIAPWPRLHVN